MSGERETVDAFAAKWTELTGQWSLVAVAMRMYRLAELTYPAGVSGQARLGCETTSS